jgi:hypothetical protein
MRCDRFVFVSQYQGVNKNKDEPRTPKVMNSDTRYTCQVSQTSTSPQDSSDTDASKTAFAQTCRALVEKVGEGDFEAVRRGILDLPDAEKREQHQELWILYRQTLQSARAHNIEDITLLVKDLLQLEHFPKPQEILYRLSEWPVLSQCMRNEHTLNLIPLLHTHGWSYQHDRNYDNHVSDMGRDLARGAWPYPDLICPDLFLNDHACDNFSAQLFLHLFFNPERLDWDRHIRRVLQLPHTERLSEGLEEGLALGPWRSEEDFSPFVEAITLLVQMRLVDTAKVIQMANTQATGLPFIRWLGEIGGRIMDEQTQHTQTGIGRPRL